MVICTNRGLFQYNRLVFGVASAPAIWPRAIDQVLQGIPGVQCYDYYRKDGHRAFRTFRGSPTMTISTWSKSECREM